MMRVWHGHRLWISTTATQALFLPTCRYRSAFAATRQPSALPMTWPGWSICYAGNMSIHDQRSLTTCPYCGLLQHCPALTAQQLARCQRCRTPLHYGHRRRDNYVSAATASAALILFVPAVTLPIMRLEQLGHVHDSSILGGAITLAQHGDVVVAGVVLLCSVVIPVGKLLALLWLSCGPRLSAPRLALTYRTVEHLGRWGMVDVLLLAVLVAALKLGDLVALSPGPAALLFTLMVILSLLAAAWFDPRLLWHSHTTTHH